MLARCLSFAASIAVALSATSTTWGAESGTVQYGRDGSAAFAFALSRLGQVDRVHVVEQIRYAHERHPRSSRLEYRSPRQILTSSLTTTGGSWTQVQVGDTSCKWFGRQSIVHCQHNPWGGTSVPTWVRGLLLAPSLLAARFTSSVVKHGKHRGDIRIIVTGRGDPYFCGPEGNCPHEARGLRRAYRGVLTIDRRTGLPSTYVSYALERKKKYLRQTATFDFRHSFTIALPRGVRVPCTSGSLGDWCIRVRR